jgi:predicted HTH transcriptional regulator
VTRPESKTLEYKKDMSSPDRIVKAAIAFANSAGGQIVIGVADDLSVVGLEDPLFEEERLANLVADSIVPQLRPAIDLVPVGGKTVLVAEVPMGSQMPYYIKGEGQYGGTYIRVGASNRQADRALVQELRRVSEGKRFELLPNFDARIEDLDLKMLSDMFGREIGVPQLRTLSLATEEQGRLVPTNAGVLVGCANPEMFLSFAWVQCARFRGPRKRDIVDNVSIYGPLPKAVDQVMEFFRRNGFTRAIFGDNPRRRDVFSLPMDALKELVVNALVHSSYADHGTAIKVAFLDDEIRIESPGGLVPGMTIDQMKQGRSSLRNPAIARVFKELHLVEQWGTGIPEVFAQLAEFGLPEPDIEEGHERLITHVHIDTHDPLKRPGPADLHVLGDGLADEQGAQVPKSGRGVGKSSAQVGVCVPKSGAQVPKSGAQVSTRGPAILRAAQNGFVTRRDLLVAAGLSQSSNNHRRHVIPLIEAGFLELEIPDKPNSSKQRYRTSSAGRAELRKAGQS